MKKLAFFLALFVGLNAGTVSRKPEEEANEVIVANDTFRRSTAAWIQRIAHSLKACYYGITKDGFIHELGLGIIHKLGNNHVTKNQSTDLPLYTNIPMKNHVKGQAIWIHFTQELYNRIETCEIDLISGIENRKF